MDTKYCDKCKNDLPVDTFQRRGKNGLQPWCKNCQKEYDRQRYIDNKEYICKQNKDGRERRRERSRNEVTSYLLEHPCVDCGEKDIIVLSFDHVRGEKEFNISDAIKDGMKWERIAKEIKKCKVRCFNCHMRKTAKQQGWFKYNKSNKKK